jgi:predicted nucleic acid-binding protein
VKGLLVDSNVILDIFLDDPHWVDWAVSTLAHYGAHAILHINPMVYAEISVGFKKIEELELAISHSGFRMLDIPREALFLAGKAFLKYRRRKGTKISPLPDFYIGAQAAVLGLDLITRDAGRYETYFPTVRLICPE